MIRSRKETPEQREFREALEWMAADRRGRLLLWRWLAPIFTPADFQGERTHFEAGRLAHAHSIMGAFAAQAPGSLVLLLTEMYREQDSRGRRADSSTDDGDASASASASTGADLDLDAYADFRTRGDLGG
jgi:hypothetical protein